MPLIDRLHPAIGKILLANSENLTPQPPSLQGKGEPDSPLLLGEGQGEGSNPSLIDQQYLDQQYLGNRGYTNKTRLRGFEIRKLSIVRVGGLRLYSPRF